MNKQSHRLVFSRSLGFCVAVAETVASSGKSASGEGSRGARRALVVLGLAAASLAAQAQGMPGGGAALTGYAPRPSVGAAATTSTLPTGATVVKGSGTVTVNGADMTVNQASQRLVTDWQSFSIGANNSVRFVQPSSSSVALNRITGDDASQIFGSLTANGHVYLENANGVYFAPGAQVSVGSLIATSLTMDLDRFMQGQVRMSGGNTSMGEVVNAGSIVAAPGGHVVLAGPLVSNTGSIVTPGGTAALVAGNAVNIDPTGSGLLNISIPASAVNARLAQSGTITADGGAVQLAAAATDAALRTVMQVDGVVRARSIEQRGGQILLSGGSSGVVAVSGQLDASGGADTQGGTIKVLGHDVGLVGAAHLDASGGTGGGTVLVGGNFQGKGPEANAANAFVGSGVVLDAGATRQGDGGKVVVWSDGATAYAGQINARGGAGGGDGGNVEVSGKGTLGFSGNVDLTAAHGATGKLLLDPTNLIVGTVADRNGDGTQGDDLINNVFAGDPSSTFPSQVKASTVATLLDTANVTLQSTLSLSVTAPISVAAGGAATTLALQSDTITIAAGAPMTLNNASLTASTVQVPGVPPASIVVNSPITSLASINLTSPTVTVGTTGSLAANNVTLSATTINLNGVTNAASTLAATGTTVNVEAAATAATMTLTGNTINLDAPTTATTMSLLANNDSAFTQVLQNSTGAGTVSAASLTIGGAPGFAGPVNADLSFSNNKIGVLSIDAQGANIKVANNPGVPLVVSGTVPADFTLTGVNTDITQPTGPLGALTLGAFEGTFSIFTVGSGNITLTNPANSLGFTNFTGAGNVNMVNSGDFGVSGAAAGNVTLAAIGGTFFLDDTIGGANVDITGAGFVNFASGPAFNIPAGGRFTIHSSDYTVDNFGTLGFGVAAGSVNNVVYGGYTGVAPATGNTLFTNETGSITPPNADNGPVSKVYDGTRNFAYTQAGTAAAGVLNDLAPVPLTLSNYTVNSSGTFIDKNAGTNKALTVAASNDTRAVSLTQNGAVLYGLQFAGYSRAAGPHVAGTPGNAVAQITAKPITATGIDGVDRVYDATTGVLLNTSAAALTGTVAGDTVSLVATTATGTLANKNVGVNKAVTVSGLTLGGADAANYSVTDASGATATISPRAITSHGVAGVDRAYDGTTTVAVSGTGASLTGVLGSDVVGVSTSGASGTVANKNVGTGKAVTVSGVTLSGLDAGNYTVTDASTATVAITPKAITATGIDGVDRVYDATTTVALDTAGAGLAGTIAGDTVNVVATGATGTLGNKNVGTNKAVTVSGLTLAGVDSGNYTVTDASGATATITPRTITSTGFTGVNRVYNGTTTVAVNGSGAALSGVLGSDVVTVNASGASGTTADKNVGTGKAVAVGGVALGGADGGNYTVVDASGATVNITPLGITSRGVTGVDRTYDGTTVVAVNASGATLSGAIAGDNVSVVAAGASGTIADKNVGVAKPVTVSGLSLGGGDAANYTLTDASAATATITALAVQATGITAVNRADDGSTVVGLNTSRAGIAGILPGDSVGINASGAVGSVATPGPGEAKPVTVTGIALTGPDALDYSVLPTPVNASGGPLTVRILTILESNFDDIRFKEYLQAVSDAQEPFRRAMLEALLSGFGKENIRKQLQRGLVFETGLAPPAVDIIEPAKAPPACTPSGADLSCGK